MRLIFEGTGSFITAVDADGHVVIRCPFDYTDCRNDQNLDSFTRMHGGIEKTVEYLKETYSAKTRI